jgi:hypothetical protein
VESFSSSNQRGQEGKTEAGTISFPEAKQNQNGANKGKSKGFFKLVPSVLLRAAAAIEGKDPPPHGTGRGRPERH